jgi:transcriptional regulator with XRE-family HTH domain
MKQGDLAALLGTTQSSVSGWINGKYEPSAGTVFAIEHLLEMAPGQLSGHLGYLPLEAGSGLTGVDVVIARCPDLEEEDKAVLISLYELLAAKRARSIGTRRTVKPAATSRTRRSTTGTTRRPAGNASTRRTGAGGG